MTQPRRVSILVRSLAGGGGAERMMVVLAGAFAERGHPVDLVLGRVEGAFVESVPDTVRVVDLGDWDLGGTLRMLARDPRNAAVLVPAFLNANPPWILGCAPALVRYLERERPAAVFSALSYTNVAALWARRVSSVDPRLVVSERNTLSVRAASAGRRRLRVLPAVVRHFYPWADAITAVSQGVADDLAGILGAPRDAVHTLYNPVVTPDIPQRCAEPVDHPWLAPGAPPLLLGAGKLKRQKDFATLLRAFAKLRAGRELRLLILGEGPQREELETLARELGVADDVALPGFVENPFAYMARASVFALSSAWEGLPAVLIQAMACGCPVVSTDCPSGPSEILEGGAHGPLVPVGDADALAAVLARVLDSPPDRDALRRRAAFFSVDGIADRTLALLLGGSEQETSSRCAASAES